MTARDLATIAAKLVGLYVLMLTVSRIPTTWRYLAQLPARSVFDGAIAGDAVAILFESFVFLGVGIALFAGARTWGARLFPDRPETPATPSVSAERLEIVALSVAGMVILAGVVPRLMSVTYAWVMLARTGRQDPFVEMMFGSTVSPAALIELVMTVVVGLWLTLRAHGLANVVRRFRDGGWARGRAAEEEQR